MFMEKSNETIGNRTRDLPACSAVPQTTVPPRAVWVSVGVLMLKQVVIISTTVLTLSPLI